MRSTGKPPMCQETVTPGFGEERNYHSMREDRADNEYRLCSHPTRLIPISIDPKPLKRALKGRFPLIHY